MNNRIKFFLGTANMFLVMRTASSNLTITWLLLSICSLLFIVRTVSFCKGHENTWLFLLTAIGTVPINVKVTKLILESKILDSGIPIVGPILAAIEAYLLLFAVEEILIGIIGRLLFRTQYEFGKEML